MKRFHFHVHDGTCIPDDEGILLKDERAARVEAVAFAGALLIEHRETFWEDDGWRLQVTDDLGAPLFTLRFLAEDEPSPRLDALAGSPSFDCAGAG